MALVPEESSHSVPSQDDDDDHLENNKIKEESNFDDEEDGGYHDHNDTVVDHPNSREQEEEEEEEACLARIQRIRLMLEREGWNVNAQSSTEEVLAACAQFLSSTAPSYRSRRSSSSSSFSWENNKGRPGEEETQPPPGPPEGASGPMPGRVPSQDLDQTRSPSQPQPGPFLGSRSLAPVDPPGPDCREWMGAAMPVSDDLQEEFMFVTRHYHHQQQQQQQIPSNSNPTGSEEEVEVRGLHLAGYKNFGMSSSSSWGTVPLPRGEESTSLSMTPIPQSRRGRRRSRDTALEAGRN